MLLLIFIMTLISSMTVPYLYLDHVRKKNINDTLTICREVVELIGAVNNHYMIFIGATGEYIDFVEQQARVIRMLYDNGKGSITRGQMLTALNALSSVGERDTLIKSLWTASSNTLTLPGSESTETFIDRLGIGNEINGNIGASDSVRSVTVYSRILSWITSPPILSHIPQVWSVEITIVPSSHFDIGTLRKNLFENIKSNITKNNECIKVTVVKAEQSEVIIRMEYSISGILEDNMSMFGM